MSVSLISEIPFGNDGVINDKLERKYTRVFNVYVTNLNDSALAVRTATGIPRVYDVYAATDGTFDLGALCREVKVVRDGDNPHLWVATCSYDSAVEEADQQNENPLLRPADVSWSFQQFEKVLDLAYSATDLESDIRNVDVVNSAGERFDPPVQVDDSRLVLKVKRNEISFNPAVAIEYQDAVNIDTFYGSLPNTAKLTNLSSDRRYENNTYYWETNYEVHFRRDGWNLQILDAGTYKLVAGERIVATDRNGFPVTSPVPLDGNGGQLTGTGYVYRKFRPYRARNFSLLRLL